MIADHFDLLKILHSCLGTNIRGSAASFCVHVPSLCQTLSLCFLMMEFIYRQYLVSRGDTDKQQRGKNLAKVTSSNVLSMND